MTFKDPDQALIDLIDKDNHDTLLIQRIIASGANPNAVVMHKMETAGLSGGRSNGHSEFPILARAILRINYNAVIALIGAGAKVEKDFIIDNEEVSMKKLARMALAQYPMNKNAKAILILIKEERDAFDRKSIKREAFINNEGGL